PNTRIIELKITMVPHAAAPSVAHSRPFEASIARVANRGSMAPTVRVDHDLRGATIQIDGWNAATAIRMVRLHATNSPSPRLWQSRDYDVSVIHTGEGPATVVLARDPFSVQKDAERAFVSGLPVPVSHRLSAGLEPTDVNRAANRMPLEPAPAAEHRVIAPKRDQPACDVQEVAVDLRPVDPRKLVVLAVSVVVACLRPAELVTHEQHRHALREEKGGQQVALLLRSALDDTGVYGLAFRAAVPRAVERFAVGVPFAVRGVVLLVVGDEVAQREAVVRRDEVDAGHRPARVVLVEVGASREPRRQLRDSRRFTSPEIAHCVSEPAVPFRPEGGEVADLVAALADVPWLRDELDATHHRDLVDEVEKGRQPVDLVKFPSQRRREV